MKEFSVLIPVHDEAENLKAFAADFLAALDLAGLLGHCREIWLAENGSRDRTPEICRELAASNPLFRTFSVPHPSYGEALKRGFDHAAAGPLVLLECDCLDADFTARALAALEDGAEFVVGGKTDARRPFLRKMLTRSLNFILKCATGYPGGDTRGLKAGRAELFRDLASQCITEGEDFQTELVLLAWKKGKILRRLPFAAVEKRPARSPLARRAAGMLPGILRLRKSLSRFERRSL